MGLLVNGVWQDEWYDTHTTQGKFIRTQSQFRNFITTDGSPGTTGKGGYKAEKGRYHLYVANACPWAHRALIFRQLKGLEDFISVSTVHWLMLENGWEFRNDDPEFKDDLFNQQFLYQAYTRAEANYSGRVTVPVLWDKQTKTIVNNESSEIIRMFNSAFDSLGATEADYYPTELRPEIDALNERIYSQINNGVYKAGFATSQNAYVDNVTDLFSALDWLEQLLSNKRYLTGDKITEADWRLFTTLVRFDPVYVGHFKCNIQRIADYPNLFAYVRDLYQQQGISETVNIQQIKQHYYMSHTMINPTGVVPFGPEIDYLLPHNRANLS